MFPAEMLSDNGMHEFRSLKGDVRIPFKWLGDHPVEGQTGRVFVWPSGAAFPVSYRRAGIRVQPWSLEAITVGEDSQALFNLLSSGQPVGVYHSPAECNVDGCTIPVFQPVWVTAFPSVRADLGEVARRRWSVDVVPADRAQIGEVAASDWGDVARLGDWGAVAMSDWGQIARGEL